MNPALDAPALRRVGLGHLARGDSPRGSPWNGCGPAAIWIDVMQTLDYSKTQRRSSRSLFYGAGFFVALAAFVLLVSMRPQKRPPATASVRPFFLVDSTVPGTAVYFRDKLLGKTPLSLSKADWTRFGLPVTTGQSASPSGIVNSDPDGWGEGLCFHDPATNTDPRLMYKVPPSYEKSYLEYDTPWGKRTKMACGEGGSGGFRSYFMSRGQDGIGVLLRIDLANAVASSDRKVNLVVTASNTGSAAYSGVRPEVEFLWGTFDVQWQHRFHKTSKLPPEWANIAPGQTLQTTLSIDLPKVSGDYSLFAILNLFQPEHGEYLVGKGSVYSDSKLLKVP